MVGGYCIFALPKLHAWASIQKLYKPPLIINCMRNLIKISVLLSSVLVLFVRCMNDKEDYFARPSWLEPPIYEVLQKQGRFTNYLKCVDRTLYAPSLKASGLYTVFAPNDEAFSKYLTNKGYASVADMPDSLVNKIVGYSMVSDKYPFARLTDVLSAGWDTLTSIRKKTVYYESIYPMNYQGNDIWIYDRPGNLKYVNATTVDQNCKYIPFYLDKVFNRSHTASDYELFYPGRTYTGSNVQNASIITKDMYAENGVAHEVDQVIEPLPNLEKMLDDPDYSDFKAIINQKGSTGAPYFISYTYDAAMTTYFQKAFPEKKINAVYEKYYTGLPFSLCGERYGVSAKEFEQGGFTVFAPNNDAVKKFYDEKLKQYYPNGWATVPVDILGYFINAHMADDMIWPGSYKTSMNYLREYLNGATGTDFNSSDFSKIAPASNGLFYGSKDYVKSSYFETVYTEILLNPAYSFFNKALNLYFSSTLKEDLLQSKLNGLIQDKKYIVLLPSDAQLAADGFNWVWLSSAYGFSNTNSVSSLGSFDAPTRMQRLIKSHVFKRLSSYDMANFQTDANFTGAYDGYSYAVNDYGDMIRYKGNKIQMIGNADENDFVTATPYKTYSNGQVFTIDKMLQYSPRNLAPVVADRYKQKLLYTYISSMATTNPSVSQFAKFVSYYLQNNVFSLSADLTSTIFMPNNTAMAAAVANQVLPAYPTTNFNPNCFDGDATKRNQMIRFIYYHILKGKQYVDDGLPCILPNDKVVKEEIGSTVLRDVADNTYLAVRKSADGKLLVSTQVEASGAKLSSITSTATVVRGITHSNFFGANSVLHEIDGYMSYGKVQ